jgi:zinc transporter ZupT
VWGTSINFERTLLEKEPALRYEELNRKLVLLFLRIVLLRARYRLHHRSFVPIVIPFAAGNFIYIAGSDLIPELRKDEPNPRKAALQVASISLGIITMLFLLLID